MTETRTRAMTESAIFAALTLILTIIGLYVPFIGGFAILVWSLPTVITIVRHGLRAGIMEAVVASALIAMLIEPMTAVRLAVAFVPVGIVMGFGFRMKWTGAHTLIFAIVVSVISKGLVLYILFIITGIEPFSMQFDAMEESVGSVIGMYEKMGMNEAQLAATKEIAIQNISLFRLLVPLFIVAIGLTDAAATFILSGIVLGRFGENVPTLPSFRNWRFTPIFIYLFMLSILGLYWGEKENIELLKTISMNVFFAAMLAGFIEALALYAYAVRHFAIPRVLAAILLMFLTFNALFARIFMFVGLLDTLFDYRKRYWSED